TVSDSLAHQADVFATIAAILGVEIPDDAGEDSFSLLSVLKGETDTIRESAVSCSMRGVPAYREGTWKLILDQGSGGWSEGQDESARVQLYDLSSDISEQQNLAAMHPERVMEMQERFEAVITRGRSTPGPNQKNDVRVQRYPRGN
ncbi:MAG: arylsulfatase, partial [Planctomycetaceae bacterium]|nr:arylsulfatase [Planctomycetaceae bacterium]